MFENLSDVTLVDSDKSVLNDKINELLIPGWVKAKEEGSDPARGHVIRRSNLQPSPKRFRKDETVEMFLLNILPFSGNNIQFIMLDLSSDVTVHVMQNMRKDIENYCSSLSTHDKYVPRTGELCLAKFDGNVIISLSHIHTLLLFFYFYYQLKFSNLLTLITKTRNGVLKG